MKTINRQAILIRPARPMIEWIQKVDVDLGNEPLAEESILDGGTNVYLVPDSERVGAAEKFLRKSAANIFAHELEGWYLDESLWPKHRGWKVFDEWFEWEVAEMVYDLGKTPIESDPF